MAVENTPPKKVGNATEYTYFLKALMDESKAGTLRAQVSASGTQGLGMAEAVARTGWPAERIIAAALPSPEVVRVGDNFIFNRRSIASAKT